MQALTRHPTSDGRRRRRLVTDQRGQVTLEWALLVGLIAVPAYGLIQLGLAILVSHYQLAATLLSLPGP